MDKLVFSSKVRGFSLLNFQMCRSQNWEKLIIFIFFIYYQMLRPLLLLALAAVALAAISGNNGNAGRPSGPPQNRPGRFLSLPVPEKCAQREFPHFAILDTQKVK